MKNKVLLFLCISIFSLPRGYSQELTNYDLYAENSFLYNPAYTIGDNDLEGFLNSRIQWLGFDGAPRTYTFGLHGNLGEHTGVGLSIVNVESGLVNDLKIKLHYAYEAKFSNNHFLRLGIAGGLMNYKIGSSNTLVNQSDIVLVNEEFNGNSFSASVGLSYFYKNIELQISMPQFINRKELDSYTIGAIAYNYRITSEWDVKPLVLSKISQHSPTQFDFNLITSWRNTASIQLGYRSNQGLLAAFTLNMKGLVLSYGYLTNLGELSSAISKTHEIQLAFRIKEYSKRLISNQKR